MMALVGLVVLAAWCVAVPLGLARALIGSEPSAAQQALVFLPGIALACLCFVIAAWPKLVAQAGRWRPGAIVEGFERRGERPRKPRPTPVAPPAPIVNGDSQTPYVAPPLNLHIAQPAPALVHLGPQADPAWAAWWLRWEAPGHGSGTVVLPSGPRILVGRDPLADVVIRLDQVSWQHLELDVREGEVMILDLESLNGSRLDDTPIPARRPTRWTPHTSLQIASPTAITLTLEALR